MGNLQIKLQKFILFLPTLLILPILPILFEGLILHGRIICRIMAWICCSQFEVDLYISNGLHCSFHGHTIIKVHDKQRIDQLIFEFVEGYFELITSSSAIVFSLTMTKLNWSKSVWCGWVNTSKSQAKIHSHFV